MRQPRREGYIKPAKPTYTGRSYLFLDTESHIVKINDKLSALPLRLGVAIYHKIDVFGNTKKRIVFRFKTQQQFINIFISCLRVKEPLNVIAHNMAFDHRVLNLPRLFNSLGYYSIPPIINDRLFIWRVKTDKGNALFYDTANYAVESVEKLGKDLKFPKMEINFDNPNDEEMFVYCQRDVEIIEKFMVDFHTFIFENKLGRYQLSLASQALAAWKTSLMDDSVYIHNDLKTLELERESYHGGRVEMFKQINDKCGMYHLFDINSLYPFIMETKPVPQTWIKTRDNVPLKYFDNHPQTHYYIADCLIETNEPVFSIVHDDKLLFPVGKFRSTIHHEELMYGLQRGYIKKIFHLAIYKAKILFSKYVNFFKEVKFKAEQGGNGSWRYIAKIFSNSFYGKWGQLQVHRQLISTEISDKVWRMPGYDEIRKEYLSSVFWFGELWEETRHGECTHSNPAIAGAITASARMLFWSICNKIGKENCYYGDTDSFICNDTGAYNLYDIIDDRLYGFLKHEGSTNLLHIRGAKDYSFGVKNKVKGVPHKAILTDAQKWNYDQFMGVKEWINKGASGDVLVYKREKERRSPYNKGIVGVDGWVKPHLFDYLEGSGNVCLTEQVYT